MDYYVKKSRWIKKLYNTCTNWLMDDMLMFNQQFRDETRSLIQAEYDNIINNLPYIGGRKNIFTVIIILNGWFVCVYRSLKHKLPIDVIAYLNRKVSMRLFHKVPRFLGVFIGGVAFKKIGQNFLYKQAQLTQKKMYKSDFVYVFDTVTTTFTFSECAVHKYYEQENANELKPYCNFADPLYSAYFQMGCRADHTFAQGYNECILSYDRHRESPTPDNITEMINRAEAFLANTTI